MKENMEKTAGIVALVSASLASVCCLGPIVLVGLGLGGVGLAAGFAKYRPIFLGLTAAILGVAFYLTYRKREVACADGRCEFRSGSKTMKTTLWVITVLAVGLATFPAWSAYALRNKPSAQAGGETIRLKISGMTCTGCAVGIEKSLMKIPGVLSAAVDFASTAAIVHVEPGVPKEKLLEAVRAAGFYMAEVQ